MSRFSNYRMPAWVVPPIALAVVLLGSFLYSLI